MAIYRQLSPQFPSFPSYSKEQIVGTCSREMKGWKDETGQQNSGSFYYARDDVRPAICSGLQDPRQHNHRHRDPAEREAHWPLLWRPNTEVANSANFLAWNLSRKR